MLKFMFESFQSVFVQFDFQNLVVLKLRLKV